jgi:TIR domain
MADYFVSYTGSDTAWAEWIAWVLEEEGHKVTLQKWDFRPGGNFVIQMQEAAGKADRTIAVLSPDYLKSSFGTPEWAAAFADDPMGSKMKLVPVRVRECDPKGLLKAVIRIDLVGVDEVTARQQLIDGLSTGRAKPSSAPSFPGPSAVPRHPAAPFPGEATSGSSASSAPYIPKVRREITDLDRRRFAQQGFKQVKQYFERALAQLKASHAELDIDFVETSATEFNAEIFIHGKSKCRCRIWLGGMFGNNDIAYAEGSSISGNAMNDCLSVTTDHGDLALRTLMGGAFGRVPKDFDAQHLSHEQAARVSLEAFCCTSRILTRLGTMRRSRWKPNQN